MNNNIAHIVYEQIKPDLEHKRCDIRGYFRLSKIVITWVTVKHEFDHSSQTGLKLKTTANPVSIKQISESHTLELNEQCCTYTIDQKQTKYEWHNTNLIDELIKIIKTIPVRRYPSEYSVAMERLY
jgi:hypothetical protein